MIQKICLSSLVCLTFLTLCETSHAQMFFEADALYYGRDDGSGKNIVNGPESVGLGKDGFGGTAGYRLTIGGAVADYDIDAGFMQLDTWNGSSQGEFMDAISFYADGPMGSNTLAPFTSLFQAASSGSMANDETTEN